MPRVVDHSERRSSIILHTWQLIAQKGIDATSMRDIAHAAGYANAGTLSHYFSSKNDLMQRAYEFVYEATNERIALACAGATGLEFVRLMANEIAPVSQLTVGEASIALSFWQRALHDDGLARTSRVVFAEWRVILAQNFEFARESGEIGLHYKSDILADQLLALLFGMHVTGLLDEQHTTTERQTVLLEAFFEGLHAV
jgi:AcrR family transcriptional regulator